MPRPATVQQRRADLAGASVVAYFVGRRLSAVELTCDGRRDVITERARVAAVRPFVNALLAAEDHADIRTHACFWTGHVRALLGLAEAPSRKPARVLAFAR